MPEFTARPLEGSTLAAVPIADFASDPQQIRRNDFEYTMISVKEGK